MVTITPVDDENKDDFSFESLIGDKLLKDVKGTPVPTKEVLNTDDTSIVALYFSAHWCPPCKRFTPMLTDFYNAAKEAKCGIEIVFVSSDRNQEEFDEYYGAMPWLAMPIEGSAEMKIKLSQQLGVTGIPTIAVFDLKTGEFIAGGTARDDVVQSWRYPEKVIARIAKWKAMERHPIEEASKLMDLGSTAGFSFGSILRFLAKNPLIIFGLIYLYKSLTKTEIFDDGTSKLPIVEEVMPDSEFESEFDSEF